MLAVKEATTKGTRSFSADIISVFTSNVFSLIANLLVVVIISRVLGPEGYGLYTALLVVPLIVVSFFQMGIRPATVFMLGSGNYDPDKVVSGVVSILFITGSAGMFFSGIAYLVLLKPGFTHLLIALSLASIPIRLFTIYAGGIFLAKEQMRNANLMNWLTALLMLVFSIIIVWIIPLGINGAALGFMVSNLIVAVYAVVLLNREYKIRISLYNPIISKMLSIGVIYAISFLIIQLNFRIDIILLQWLSTKKELGLYSLGVGVAELLWQIPLAIGMVVMTRSANSTDSQAMNESTALLLRLSLIAGILLSVFIFFISPYMIPLIFGHDYQTSVSIIRTILPGIIMIIVFRILGGQLSGMGKPGVAIYAFIPALILNVVLNYFLIPSMGGMGAAISSNISYLVGNLIFLIIYCRIAGTTIARIFHFSKRDLIVLVDYVNRIRQNSFFKHNPRN